MGMSAEELLIEGMASNTIKYKDANNGFTVSNDDCYRQYYNFKDQLMSDQFFADALELGDGSMYGPPIADFEELSPSGTVERQPLEIGDDGKQTGRQLRHHCQMRWSGFQRRR